MSPEREIKLSMAIAGPDDASWVADLRNEAAAGLSREFGPGHWSYQTTAKAVGNAMKGKSKVFVMRSGNEIVGTLCLQSKKPWAIDVNYFTRVEKPVYLVDMAIKPGFQRKGIGRQMLESIIEYVVAWPADAIRLDAYDSTAGAGAFYGKCGFLERGHVIYKGNPLVYFELIIKR